ncbi:Cytochrome b6-f complex iron-sulfur subunit [Austwickia sp. TVS 96-490-7B]|uniref:Rieske (2Fe-2S) protein n=1 Tax=Austwickia sp. TVS 96-490-7B TaxID=2830843 RepID=UPI001C55E0E2|nr:Rieske (2Fe-2S) protein [Austwickia sp. TVS 96-490-7B]MBW3086236.1 Cytochrome b6-f complex iron-sulfur subunit [Austwickia sp. TVS 96-490-7B]
MTTTPPPTAHPSAPRRRDVLTGAAVIALAGTTVTVLSSCGGGQNTPSAATPAPPTLDASTTQKISAAITAGKVPVGSATVLAGTGIALAQPAPGEYTAFSTACPHQGGAVSEVSSRGFLRCPLHGSEFDPKTGEVKVGPADRPLTATKLKVDGDKVSPA